MISALNDRKDVPPSLIKDVVFNPDTNKLTFIKTGNEWRKPSVTKGLDTLRIEKINPHFIVKQRFAKRYSRFIL